MKKILNFINEVSFQFLNYFIFFFVNGIFIIKYGLEYFTIIQTLLLLLGYVVVLSSFIYFSNNFVEKKISFKFIFRLIVPVFFFATIVINNRVDAETLMTDRWAALEISINAVLQREYPYNIVDFMGNEPSNLPTMVILAMPFEIFFGDVGYLQSFGFLVFVAVISKLLKNHRERVLAIVLLICSPAYLYEIYTKSDLFTNFIIASGSILFFWKYFIKSTGFSYEYVAVGTALLLMTRVPILFPLTILLFRRIFCFTVKQKVKFAFIFILTTLPFLLLFFLPAESWKIIQEHNPLRLQSKQPVLFSLIFLSLSLILSFKVKNLRNVLDYSALVLFLSVFSSFLWLVFKFGLTEVFFESGFDISYFNAAMPFVILSVCLSKDAIGGPLPRNT